MGSNSAALTVNKLWWQAELLLISGYRKGNLPLRQKKNKKSNFIHPEIIIVTQLAEALSLPRQRGRVRLLSEENRIRAQISAGLRKPSSEAKNLMVPFKLLKWFMSIQATFFMGLSQRSSWQALSYMRGSHTRNQGTWSLRNGHKNHFRSVTRPHSDLKGAVSRESSEKCMGRGEMGVGRVELQYKTALLLWTYRCKKIENRAVVTILEEDGQHSLLLGLQKKIL